MHREDDIGVFAAFEEAAEHFIGNASEKGNAFVVGGLAHEAGRVAQACKVWKVQADRVYSSADYLRSTLGLARTIFFHYRGGDVGAGVEGHYGLGVSGAGQGRVKALSASQNSSRYSAGGEPASAAIGK